jgi:hypothetical protein
LSPLRATMRKPISVPVRRRARPDGRDAGPPGPQPREPVFRALAHPGDEGALK